MTGRWKLLPYFLRQDLAQRYTGQVSGIAWVVVGPLLQLALFALVFGHIFQARVPGLEAAGYVAFLALGMWPWFAFADAVTRASTALTDHAGLLGKVAVPPPVLIAARATSPFLLHGAGFLLVLGALALGGVPLHWSRLPVALLPWLPLYVLALGAGALAAALQVFVRDIGQLIGYVLAALMFLSPILYTRAMAPRSMQPWLGLNPFAGLIEGVRDPLLHGRLALGDVALASFVGLGLALLCLAAYRRVRPHLQDFL